MSRKVQLQWCDRKLFCVILEYLFLHDKMTNMWTEPIPEFPVPEDADVSQNQNPV